MEQRECKNCKSILDIDKFASAGIINGVKYYRYLCVKCYSESKKPRKKLLRDWYTEYKKTLRCERCNNSDYRVLEFHHSSDKDFSVADGMSRGYSIDKIKEEINKCTVLCANCHRIVHYNENVV